MLIKYILRNIAFKRLQLENVNKIGLGTRAINLSQNIQHFSALGSSVTLLNNNVQTTLDVSLRFKSRDKITRKKDESSNKTDDNESDDDDDEDDDGEFDIDNIDTSDFPKGFKITKRSLASLRCDLAVSAGLGIARNKIEDKFYGGKIRYNGQKLLKKAQKMKELDTVDLIENDEVKGEVTKRVLLYKLLKQNEETGRCNVILVTWKGGI